MITPRNAVRAAWVLWILTGFAGSLAIGDAVDGRSATARWVVAVVGWAMAGIVVVGLAVPSTAGLTVVRLIVPAAVPAAACALALGASPTAGALFVAASAAATLTVMSGELGQAFAQASAYGDEVRFPLRAPVRFVAPLAVSWLLWCAALTTATLLLAAGRWVPGIAVGAAAAGLTALLLLRYHAFSRRWLVVVPAGVVVHDPVVLAGTLLVLRADLAGVQLALAGTGAADLTGPAAGHLVEVSLRDTTTVVLNGGRAKPEGTALHVRSFLVAPSRPGRALREAGGRGLPVG